MTRHILVLGAAGRIARHVVDDVAVDPDLALTLLVRDAGRLGAVPARARVVEGDVLDAAVLSGALEGQDLVYANLTGDDIDDQARAVIDGVRLANPADPAPWVIVAEALEAHDELDAAHDTFTQALTLLASPQPATTGDGVARALETPGSADAQDAAAPQAPPSETRPLIFGRHRVRRMLGADHDDWDALAATQDAFYRRVVAEGPEHAGAERSSAGRP